MCPAFPPAGRTVEDGVLRERIISEILTTCLADNTRARFLRADGTYELPKLAAKSARRRSQFEFMALSLSNGTRTQTSESAETAPKKLTVMTKPPRTGGR